MLVMNYLNFCLSDRVITSLSFLKDYFTLEFQCGFIFPFQILNISLQLPLDGMVSDENSTRIIFLLHL